MKDILDGIDEYYERLQVQKSIYDKTEGIDKAKAAQQLSYVADEFSKVIFTYYALSEGDKD